MNKFKELLEKRKNPKESKELKDIIKDKEDPSDYWADFLDYNGQNLLGPYIKFLKWFESNTEELEDTSWTEEMCDDAQDEDGNWYEDCWDEEITRSKQESYLGYIPSDDQFVTGFDMWEGDDNPAGIVYWRYIKGKYAIIKEEIDYSSDMIYGPRGAYKKLHKKHKDLVDIRLD